MSSFLLIFEPTPRVYHKIDKMSTIYVNKKREAYKNRPH